MIAQAERAPGDLTNSPPRFRVAVTGSRDWWNAVSVRRPLNALLKHYGSLTLLHGVCPSGADRHAEVWYLENLVYGLDRIPFPADWSRQGSQAGMIRNGVMLRAGADLVLAFARPCRRRRPWCPAGEHPSHGTADCVKQARGLKIPVRFSPDGMSW